MYDLYVWAGFYLFSVISNLTHLREPNNKLLYPIFIYIFILATMYNIFKSYIYMVLKLGLEKWGFKERVKNIHTRK